MLCPQDDPRRHPPHQADRMAAEIYTSDLARHHLETLWDAAATGDADLDEAAAHEAAARLARITCINAARRLPWGCVRQALLAKEAQELREIADEIAHAAAWI